jgi:hypothetical protein
LSMRPVVTYFFPSNVVAAATRYLCRDTTQVSVEGRSLKMQSGKCLMWNCVRADFGGSGLLGQLLARTTCPRGSYVAKMMHKE